jgi:hypothetical protein
MGTAAKQNRTPGITAIVVFFVFGAIMSGLAAVMLTFPASPIEFFWRVNPRAHEGFQAMGFWAVVLMIAVCVACATASTGLARSRQWGLWTAIAILAVNIAGDSANAVFAHDWTTLIGLPIGGLMIVYLVKKRNMFSSSARGDDAS